MKVFIALFLLALTVPTLAVRTQKQKALFDQSLVSKLKSSNLGRAVLMFAEVHSKQGNQNYNKLFDALDDLADSLEARITDEKKDYTLEQESFNADNQFYQAQVDQYQAEIAQHQIDVKTLTQTRISYEETLANKRSELSETYRQKNLVTQGQVFSERKFKDQNNDFNQALTVIDKALELLGQARNSAFVETNHHEYKYTADSMKETLSNYRLIYQPIADALIQVTSGDFADQQKLTKAVKLLQEMRASLDESRLSLQAAFENEKREAQELAGQYDKKISQLQDVIIPGLLEDIETKEGEIKTKSELLSSSQDNYQQSNDSLTSLNQSFTQRTNSHKELVQEYNKELEVLGECIEALNAGGVKRT